MEVRSANIALTNRAAAAIDNSGSNGKEQHPAMKVNSAVPEESQDLDEQSVMISISAAGLRRSLLLEKRLGQNELQRRDREAYQRAEQIERRYRVDNEERLRAAGTAHLGSDAHHQRCGCLP